MLHLPPLQTYVLATSATVQVSLSLTLHWSPITCKDCICPPTNLKKIINIDTTHPPLMLQSRRRSTAIGRSVSIVFLKTNTGQEQFAGSSAFCIGCMAVRFREYNSYLTLSQQLFSYDYCSVCLQGNSNCQSLVFLIPSVFAASSNNSLSLTE